MTSQNVDVFKYFITDELIQMIVEQANLYVSQYFEANPNLEPHTSAKQWKDVTSDAIKKFLALFLIMGIVQKPSIRLYWSQEPLLKTSIFNAVMSRNRFQIIFAFLQSSKTR